MNKLTIMKNAIIGFGGRSGLLLKKHSPEILLITGVTGIVVSTVMACKATLKVDAVLDETKEKIDKIKKGKETLPEEKYSDDDYRKDLTVAYAQSGFEFVKLYGPAFTVGLVSLGCILGAHNIMRKRNIALMAAYKCIEQSYTDYRKRVVDELGEDADKHFKYGTGKLEITEAGYTDENGVEHPAKTTTVDVVDPNNISEYARFFDESNKNWQKNHDYNLLFLKTQQNLANDLLQSRGHVFLNEVYDGLGLKRSTPGALVGWVKGQGDDFIDFGLYDVGVSGYANEYRCDTIAEERRDFINGYRESVLLDFNVSGVIYDMI